MNSLCLLTGCAQELAATNVIAAMMSANLFMLYWISVPKLLPSDRVNMYEYRQMVSSLMP